MARLIFITGGVVSSLGKGLASAALGALLQARGYKVRLRKLDHGSRWRFAGTCCSRRRQGRRTSERHAVEEKTASVCRAIPPCAHIALRMLRDASVTRIRP